MLRERTTLCPDGAAPNELYHEILKCKDDPVYFIKTYCKIAHPIENTYTFDLHSFQEDAVRIYQSKNRIIQVDSRQTGKTTLLMAYVLWYVIFHSNKVVFFTSPTLPMTYDTRNRFGLMLSGLPRWMKKHLELTPIVDNRKEIMLKDFSSVLFQPLHPDITKGLNISLLVCDEFALSDSQTQRDFFNNVIPTMSPSDKVIIATGNPITPSSFFSDLCKESALSSDPYTHITWNWDIVPGRTEDWMEQVRVIMGEEHWKREYEVDTF